MSPPHNDPQPEKSVTELIAFGCTMIVLAFVAAGIIMIVRMPVGH